MDTEKLIKTLEKQRDELTQRIEFLTQRKDSLKDLPDPSLFGTSLDFDHLPHDEVIKVVRAFGGKWAKTKNAGFEDKIDYQQQIGPLTVRCWAGQPPPSCRLVEIEEDVPEQVIPAKVIAAHKVKKFKMVCTGQGEPMVEAIGRAISDNQQASAS